MKEKKAIRAKLKVDNLWESPPLHILLTREDDVTVARCLDLTVSSHGNDEKDAINSLTEAVKEAILSAIENNVIGEIYDPAHSKYWRMFNEAEAQQVNLQLTKTLRKSGSEILVNKLAHSSVEISHAYGITLAIRLSPYASRLIPLSHNLQKETACQLK